MTAVQEIVDSWHQRVVKAIYVIRLPLKAVSKERPRVGKNGHIYTPKKTKDFEKQVAVLSREVIPAPLTGTISLNMAIIEAMPKSFTWAQRMLAKTRLLLPTNGDLDNKFKAVTDGLNGVAYIDDAQIAVMSASRRYGEQDSIAITIEQIGLSKQQTEQALYSMKVAKNAEAKANRRGS